MDQSENHSIKEESQDLLKDNNNLLTSAPMKCEGDHPVNVSQEKTVEIVEDVALVQELEETKEESSNSKNDSEQIPPEQILEQNIAKNESQVSQEKDVLTEKLAEVKTEQTQLLSDTKSMDLSEKPIDICEKTPHTPTEKAVHVSSTNNGATSTDSIDICEQTPAPSRRKDLPPIVYDILELHTPLQQMARDLSGNNAPSDNSKPTESSEKPSKRRILRPVLYDILQTHTPSGKVRHVSNTNDRVTSSVDSIDICEQTPEPSRRKDLPPIVYDIVELHSPLQRMARSSSLNLPSDDDERKQHARGRRSLSADPETPRRKSKRLANVGDDKTVETKGHDEKVVAKEYDEKVEPKKHDEKVEPKKHDEKVESKELEEIETTSKIPQKRMKRSASDCLSGSSQKETKGPGRRTRRATSTNSLPPIIEENVDQSKTTRESKRKVELPKTDTKNAGTDIVEEDFPMSTRRVTRAQKNILAKMQSIHPKSSEDVEVESAMTSEAAPEVATPGKAKTRTRSTDSVSSASSTIHQEGLRPTRTGLRRKLSEDSVSSVGTNVSQTASVDSGNQQSSKKRIKSQKTDTSSDVDSEATGMSLRRSTRSRSKTPDLTGTSSRTSKKEPLPQIPEVLEKSPEEAQKKKGRSRKGNTT